MGFRYLSAARMFAAISRNFPKTAPILTVIVPDELDCSREPNNCIMAPSQISNRFPDTYLSEWICRCSGELRGFYRILSNLGWGRGKRDSAFRYMRRFAKISHMLPDVKSREEKIKYAPLSLTYRSIAAISPSISCEVAIFRSLTVFAGLL